MTEEELSKLYAEKSHECGELRAELAAALEREKVLLEAVEAVEWVYDDCGAHCPWCHAFTHNDSKLPNHAPDCLRQRALAQGGEVKE
jgi:hypothetical protein